MTCEEFEIVVNDQRQFPSANQAEGMNTDARQLHLAHAKTCGVCATRLADRRALSAGLQALAADSKGKEAPSRIEAALLAEFRQQSASAKTNVLAFPVRRRQTQLWALAAAAILLVASAIVASQLLSNASSVDPIAPMPEKQNLASAEIVEPSINWPIKPRKKPVPRRALADRSSVVASMGEFTPVGIQEDGQEVATDFMSLTHEFDSEPLESGQLIRVQMPRTAMASFGLPVNLERANVPVKADVLLAEDGSARAIRFVR